MKKYTTEQNAAFMTALKQLCETYPTDDLGLLRERETGFERQTASEPHRTLIWMRRTGIPDDELFAVAALIYGEIPS